MKTISYEIAKSAMSLLSDMGRQGHLGMVGISQSDYDALTGPSPWLPSERNRMHTTLNALLNVSADTLGCPRFTLPAEYVAASIAVFVNPINAQSICRIMERSPSASDLGSGSQTIENCSAEQLFALVVQLYGDPVANSARARFETKTSLALGKVIADEVK